MLVLTDNATTVVKGFAEQIPEAISVTPATVARRVGGTSSRK